MQSPQEQKEGSQTFVDLILDSNYLPEYSYMDRDIIYTIFVSCFVLFLIDTIFHNMGSLGRRRRRRKKKSSPTSLSSRKIRAKITV